MSVSTQKIHWESGSAVQPLKEKTSRPIGRLHDDILLYIFRTYVEMGRPIMTLLLVCHLWTRIVTSYPSLRSNIQFTRKDHLNGRNAIAAKSGYDAVLPYDLALVCTTPKQLARAIERLHGAPFTITFWATVSLMDHSISAWDCVPWHTFSEQCTGIYIHNPGVDNPILENIPSLRNIKVFYSSVFTRNNPPTIFQKIPRDIPPPLRSLSIKSPNDLDTDLFPHVAARLQSFEAESSLRFTREKCRRLFSSFRDLQHLTWRGECDEADELRESVDWKFRLKTLTTSNIVPSIFPLSVLESLVELEIQKYRGAFSMDDHKRALEEAAISLPHLTHLTLLGCWIDLLRIDAPSLQKLVLEGWYDQPNIDTTHYLVQTRLRPVVAHLVEPGRGLLLNDLLRGPFCAVTELKVHVPVWWVLKGNLRRFLYVPTKSKRKQKGKKQPPPTPAVPNLRHLVVAVYRHHESTQDKVEKAVEAATRSRIEDGGLLSIRCMGQSVRFTLSR
ncbi:hypothetical protein FRC17_000987 [Serendipita sp. 399]|nr:hypothetical protein FRC17_000987 [Serendipita sp. 399]